MNKFNEFLAVKMTKAIGTMWAFYIFVIYGFVPVIFPQHTDKILYWSNFAQLVFLPLLAVGSAVLGKSSETQAKETHDTVMIELQELKEVHSQTTIELDALGQNHAVILEELVEIRRVMNLLQGGNEHGK